MYIYCTDQCLILFLQLIVEHCEVPIKSVELQLVRVETCGCAEGYARDGKQICVSLFNLLYVHYMYWINLPATEIAGC